MLDFLRRVLVPFSSLASIYGLYFAVFPPTEPRSPTHWVVLGLAIVLGVFVIFLDVWDYLKNRPKTYQSDAEINAYMCRWLKSGGRAAIFSRDLSWASDPHVRPVLLDKARKGELTILLAHNTPLSAELKTAGAIIVEYGETGFVPRSRFTVVDYEKDGARVAIGLKKDGKHIIEEFASGIHSTSAVAEDFVRFVIARGKK